MLVAVVTLAVEAAIQWLADHEQDDDIDMPVGPTGPSLTKEEAERKAFELQQQLRKVRERLTCNAD